MKTMMTLAALVAGTMLADAPARAADAAREAPANCEWRMSKGKKPVPMFYCLGKDGKMAYGRKPAGFTSETMASARAGDPAAMTTLGIFYLDGSESARDKALGQEWLTRAADSGSPDAAFNLGLALEQGKGLDKDEAAAAGWYRKAAAAGDRDAMLNLANMLREGRGTSRDDAEALRLTRQASDLGLANATYNLGTMTREGVGGAADRDAGFALWRKASEAGSIPAAERLGLAYATGDGVPADDAQVVFWLYKAHRSTTGIAKALFAIEGLLYTPQQLLDKAKAGDERSAMALAVMLLDEKKAGRNPKAAAGILEGLAKTWPLAAMMLAELYMNGDGVPKDTAKAAALYRRVLAAHPPQSFVAVNHFRSPQPKAP